MIFHLFFVQERKLKSCRRSRQTATAIEVVFEDIISIFGQISLSANLYQNHYMRLVKEEQLRMSIKLDALQKEYSVPDGTEVAVDGVNLEIGDKEFVSLVGPSGCGKSTTLRCIAGLETPTDGEIHLGDEDITDKPTNKRGLAMMFQNIALYPHMDIEENISYPLKVHGVSTDVQRKEAKRAAEIMQIGDLLKKYPGELSGGQRQRAALARTIVQEPGAFLMDEPLSDLDAKLKVEIRKEIQRVHARVERPTLYVTHDQEEAMTMSDRIVVMNDGIFEQMGTPDELYQEPVNIFVAQFIGNPTMNLIHGSFEAVDDDSIVVETDSGQFEFPVESILMDPQGSDAVIGFRPEMATLVEDSSNGDIEAELALIERIGDRILATLNGPEGEIRAIIPVEHELVVGQTVGVRFDRQNIHLFDGESSKIVARGHSNSASAEHSIVR